MNKTLTILAILVVVFGCKSNTQQGEKGYHQEKEEDGISMSSGGITLTEAKSLPITDAKLEINYPKNGGVYEKVTSFDFDVSNYELGSQTEDENATHCANSAKGQHIHLILNNSPYTAHYEEDFVKEIEDGRYIGLAFLSRSYHESVKTKDAYQLFNFSVGKEQDLLDFDEQAPHLFYSRPKGTYTGKDTKHVLLDFYLTNVDLSENGYKVEAVINGESFILTKWVPYIMEGLPLGENTLELKLIDGEGNLVESPFNPVKRKVVLEAEAS